MSAYLRCLTLPRCTKFRSTGYISFLDSWSNSSPVTFAIVSGFLPPAVAGIFTYFLPKVMRWLTQYMGAPTHARLDRAVIARYFAFLVISQLIIFTLIGVVFSTSRSQNSSFLSASLTYLPRLCRRNHSPNWKGKICRNGSQELG